MAATPARPPLAALARCGAAAALALSCWALPAQAAHALLPPPALQVQAPVAQAQARSALAPPRHAPSLLAQTAARVTLGGEPAFEKDPVPPFTLYGTV